MDIWKHKPGDVVRAHIKLLRDYFHRCNMYFKLDRSYEELKASTKQASAYKQAIEVCEAHAADSSPAHKPHETYTDGWLDACNEIKWAIEALEKGGK